MKRIVILSGAGAALFAAGFWSGRSTGSAGADNVKNGPVTAATAARSADGKPLAGKASATDGHVRTFAPGRPFAKGQARAWLLDVVATLHDARDNPVGLLDAAQVLLTMDESSAKEVAAALQELAELYKAQDPAVVAAVGDDDLLEGGLMLTMVRLSQLNADAAVNLIKESGGKMENEAMMFVIARIASQDPAKAEQMALTFSDREKRKALEAVIYGLAPKDPAAAMAVADRHPESIDSGDRRRILENWARRDPLRAMPAAVQAMEKAGDSEMLRQPLDEWYKTDARAAAAWAAGLEGPGKATARALMLEKRAGDDPEAVLPEFTALQKDSANPRELRPLATTLAHALAEKSISSARDWAMTLPPGELQDGAVHQVVERWVKDDAPAASEWIKTLPLGTARDNAANELSDAIVRRDPASAFEWARSIQQAGMREHAMSRSYEVWRDQDPEAAKAALEALPADMQKKLR